MKTLMTTLPIATTTESNTCEHWRAKAARAKQQRGLASLMTSALVARVRTGLRTGRVAGATVRFTRISPGTLDDDNLSSSCKHVRDGVADALGIDDRDPRVRWRYAQEKGRPMAVRIEVLEVQTCAAAARGAS